MRDSTVAGEGYKPPLSLPLHFSSPTDSIVYSATHGQEQFEVLRELSVALKRESMA
jgi:hypothetical protein